MSNEVIDLFSGCGGFSLGAELAGFRTKIAIDIDKDLHSSFVKNFPGTDVIEGDVGKIDGRFWRGKLRDNKPVGIIGGPPCQGFSRIGKRDPDDPRNSLIGHFFRHVKSIRPKFFVMENVEGLLDAGLSDVLYCAIDTVSKDYQIVGPILVNAGSFGAPTDRKRVVVVGYDPNEIDTMVQDDFLPLPETPYTTVKDAIADLPEPVKTEKGCLGWAKYPINPGSNRAYVKYCRALPPEGLGWGLAIDMLKNGQVSGLMETLHTEEVRQRFASVVPGAVDTVSRFPRLHWDKKSPTIRAGTGRDKGNHQSPRPIHPDMNRVITVREAARLQGFPDWFVFHATMWHSFRMIGNSVSPLMSKHILSVIANKL